MNSEFNDWLCTQPSPAPPRMAPTQPFPWRSWARHLLVCNPFFLCSAALLLLAVHRLSVDPNFFDDEHSNLLFNFFALQAYECLVVITAIILARRKVWYDSALLVVVENGLVLVPFMLISQGSLMNPQLGMALAAGAMLLAVARIATVRRGYPLFNLPPRALLLGTAVLALNAALPTLFRVQIDDGQEKWAAPSFWLWHLVLPLLVAGANLLPRPTRYGGSNPERHWLPIFIYALWVIASGAHFWCLSYISEQEFHLHYLGPAVVAAAWTLWWRIPDCMPQPGARWEAAMLALTFVSPLAAFGEPYVFEGLALLNALAYAILLRRRAGTTQRLLREFLFASCAWLLLGAPPEFVQRFLPGFTRMDAVLLAGATFLGISALRSSRMRVGLAGACGAGMFVALLWRAAPLHAVVETAAVFLLAHSLGWTRRDAAASLVRTLVGMGWIADAVAWMQSGAPWQVRAAISGVALALAVTWWLVAHVTGQRRDWIVLASALAVLLTVPGHWLVARGSPGLVALAASFATFAIGVAVAWTRHAWERINGGTVD